MRHGPSCYVLPLLSAAVIVAVAALAVEPSTPPAISPDQFSKLHALITPGKGEDQWAQIPWRTSLWEARKEAAAKGKPLLLWEMDGHPLGCT